MTLLAGRGKDEGAVCEVSAVGAALDVVEPDRGRDVALAVATDRVGPVGRHAERAARVDRRKVVKIVAADRSPIVVRRRPHFEAAAAGFRCVLSSEAVLPLVRFRNVAVDGDWAAKEAKAVAHELCIVKRRAFGDVLSAGGALNIREAVADWLGGRPLRLESRGGGGLGPQPEGPASPLRVIGAKGAEA